jgi:hypothetical protein
MADPCDAIRWGRLERILPRTWVEVNRRIGPKDKYPGQVVKARERQGGRQGAQANCG